MNKIIVMLGHQSKVGKDTLADELVKREGFVKIAFADKLKLVCSDLFFIPLYEFYDEKLKNEVVERYGITRRRILQIVGQALFGVDPCVWVNHAKIKFTGEYNKIVITDFRFIAEIVDIKKFAEENGYELKTAKLHREGISDFAGRNDPSELELINYPWQFNIHNNGTVEELYNNAMNILFS